MQRPEIVLPITQPETEWVGGRALQKVSPAFDHSRVQLRIGMALETWAGARGRVGTEWRFRIAPSGEARRPLVPDVAFVAAERLAGLSHDDLQVPDFAPTVVVEVLSPGDRPDDVADKIAAFIRAGTSLVIVADPRSRSLTAHDGQTVRDFVGSEEFSHPALPGFALDVGEFYRNALD